jgi:hypothetical protein
VATKSHQRSKGGANVTEPLNTTRSYDQYLFQKTYKVPQRYPTVYSDPTDVSPKGQSRPSRSLLIGAIAGSIVGGIVFGMTAIGLCVLVRQRRRRGQSLVGGLNGSYGIQPDGKMIDETEHPRELDAQSYFELAEQPRTELWAEPAELPAISKTKLDSRFSYT